MINPSKRHLTLLTILVMLSLLVSSAQACNASQYADGNGTCQYCFFNCSSCNAGTPGACSTCENGYASTGTGCDFLCDWKFVNFNNKSCDSCSSSCGALCIEMAGNCNPCGNVNYGEKYVPHTDDCSYASIGYYESITQKRYIPCPDKNCLRCDSSGKCTECISFWNLEEYTGRCTHKCDTGCKSCTQNNTCTACETGWTLLSNGTCSSNFTGCREVNSTSCVTCQEGYYLGSYGNCLPGKPNCWRNDKFSNCERCEPGYYGSGGFCNQCPSGCRYCTASKGCTACESGYFMIYDSNSGLRSCAVYGTAIPKSKTENTGLIIGLSIGGVILILIIVGVIYHQKAKKKRAEIRGNSLVHLAHEADHHQQGNTSLYQP